MWRASSVANADDREDSESGDVMEGAKGTMMGKEDEGVTDEEEDVDTNGER